MARLKVDDQTGYLVGEHVVVSEEAVEQAVGTLFFAYAAGRLSREKFL